MLSVDAEDSDKVCDVSESFVDHSLPILKGSSIDFIFMYFQIKKTANNNPIIKATKTNIGKIEASFSSIVGLSFSVVESTLSNLNVPIVPIMVSIVVDVVINGGMESLQKPK